IPIFDFLAVMSGQTPVTPPEFYADSAVIAYRVPNSDVPVIDFQPKLTSSGGTLGATLLTDGDFVKSTALPKAAVGQQAWVQFELAKRQTIRALTLALGGPVYP